MIIKLHYCLLIKSPLGKQNKKGSKVREKRLTIPFLSKRRDGYITHLSGKGQLKIELLLMTVTTYSKGGNFPFTGY
jgi:hypothetical protein